MAELKLYMVLLGCTPPGRHTEQHDFFFGIARSLPELVPGIESFWPAQKLHIDAWREVTGVDGFEVRIKEKPMVQAEGEIHRLFFINLGGYERERFEEKHYIVLTAKKDRADAFRQAKDTLFFRDNDLKGANSHIDDKYGIDVDDLYQIEDILSAEQKEKYYIELVPGANLPKDEIHLGYLRMDRLENGDFVPE